MISSKIKQELTDAEIRVETLKVEYKDQVKLENKKKIAIKEAENMLGDIKKLLQHDDDEIFLFNEVEAHFMGDDIGYRTMMIDQSFDTEIMLQKGRIENSLKVIKFLEGVKLE